MQKGTVNDDEPELAGRVGRFYQQILHPRPRRLTPGYSMEYNGWSSCSRRKRVKGRFPAP